MIWQWGAVLMAAAGLTVGVGGREVARRNQTITFVRNPAQDGTAIRVTARGPVDGFGSVRVLDFVADPDRGTFRGVWELAFRTGTIRYAFSGTARFGARELATGKAPQALVWSGAAAQTRSEEAIAAKPPREGVQEVKAPDQTSAMDTVNGEFRLGGGTGRLAEMTGRGAFHGWTLPNAPALTAYPGVD